MRWYGPRRGPKSVEGIVSHKPQVKAELRKRAESMGDYAETVLAVHRDTGDSHIDTIHAGTTDLDSYVILKASGGKRAAISIEHGHWLGADDGGERQWVDGIHPLGKAVQREKRRASLGL